MCVEFQFSRFSRSWCLLRVERFGRLCRGASEGEYPTALDSFALLRRPLNPTVSTARDEVCAEGRLCRPPAEFECIPFSPTSLTSLFSRLIEASAKLIQALT